MEGITAICNTIMTGVARAGVVTDQNIDRAVVIMRAEIKALFTSDRYADSREAIALGSINEQYVVALVIAECVDKIAQEV